MLQFNTAVCTVIGRFTPRLRWRFTALFATSSAQPLTSQSLEVDKKLSLLSSKTAKVLSTEQQAKFDELKTTVCKCISGNPTVVTEIQKTQNVHDLLSFIKAPYLEEKDIMRVMKTIVAWIPKDEGILPDESTQTSTSIQNQSKSIKKARSARSEHRDLDSDVNYTYYTDLSTSSMIQEISKLREQQNRNVHLLKFLYNNIIMYNETLSLKACSNLMFSMSVLNYPCMDLLNKISMDVIKFMPNEINPTIISILKSMSILKYKNTSLLDAISNLILNSRTLMKEKHIMDIVLSFASLGYDSRNNDLFIEKYVQQLTVNTVGADKWLTLVWSLTLLNQARPGQIRSVLNNNFVNSLIHTDDDKNLPKQLKLLNINGVAQLLIKDYEGPFLNSVPPLVNPYTKDKQSYTDLLENTLKVILPQNSFTMNVNTNMGFVLDAECTVDTNFKPVNVEDGKHFKKTGIVICDYPSYYLGSNEPHAVIKLYRRLLEASGYRVLCISYKHFGLEDKLRKRIDILKRRIQSVT